MVGCCCFTSQQHILSYHDGLPTYDSMHSWWLHSAFPTGTPGHQHHDLIPHLSWNWANQSLPYPNNAECLARKRYSINFWVIGLLTWPEFSTHWFDSHNLPNRETDAQLIWPSHLALNKIPAEKILLLLSVLIDMHLKFIPYFYLHTIYLHTIIFCYTLK